MARSTEPVAGSNSNGTVAAPDDGTARGFSRRAFLASGAAVGVGAGLGPFVHVAGASAIVCSHV